MASIPLVSTHRTASHRRAAWAGYTLVELMAVLAIAGVLLSAVLASGGLLERQRRWASIVDLERLVRYTRSEALNRETPMTLCALDNEGRCQHNWQGSEISVFADRDRNRRLDTGEAVIRSRWPESRGRLQWRASLGRPYLEYSPLGNTFQNGSFILCYDHRDDVADLVISVNRGGRPYIAERGTKRCR